VVRALRPRLSRIALLAGLFLAGQAAAPGMIFYATGNPAFNTTAPTGSLAGSGWQWVGNFGGYAATAVGPHCFVAAHHIGGTVGLVFVLNGIGYTTTSYVDDTVSDLRLWQVAGTFPSWAPLYRTSDEPGKPLVVFGMGDGQGAAVTVDGGLKGWLWGGGQGTLRWGTNVVYDVVNAGSYWGNLLYALFDPSGGPNVADLANGDSSGPVFINTSAGWCLAGVAAVVDGPFSYDSTGSDTIDAALFDARGLYIESGSGWELIAGPHPVPAGFYATQVSARATWIDGIANPDLGTPLLDGPKAVALALLLAGVGWAALRGRPAAECP
jgi:hypothetical protein